MKKILFTLLCAAFVFQSCSKEEEEEKVVIKDKIDVITYNSKDSIHHYALDEKILYKQKRGEFTSVWEKPSTPPDPIKIDLGYGEFKEIGYDYSRVVLDTDNNIFSLWIARYTTNDDFEEKYKFSIGMYSSSGDFIKNKEIDLGKYSAYKFVEMYNGNILLGYNSDYFIMDKDLNIIEQHKNKPLPFNNFVKFVNNERYIAYNSSSVIVFDWTKKEIIGPDINTFLAEKYPDEEHTPKFSLSNMNLKSNHAEAVLKVTLYNGKTESINLRIDYDSGKIIK